MITDCIDLHDIRASLPVGDREDMIAAMSVGEKQVGIAGDDRSEVGLADLDVTPSPSVLIEVQTNSHAT